jgi:hypothetical protein
MNLDKRALTLSQPPMVGSDVDRLHAELSALGDPYRALVARDVDREGRATFGDATKQAVTQFQQANRQRLQTIIATSLDGTADVRWSGDWGAVDPATAQVINEEVARITRPFMVCGRVDYEDGTPAEGVRVRVFDRDIGSNRDELTPLDGLVTNAGGIFPDLSYTSRPYAEGAGRRGSSADLVFSVEGRDTVVDVVAVYRLLDIAGRREEQPVDDLVLGFPALPVETVRVVIRRQGDAGLSEYERVMAALQPLLVRHVTPDQFDEAQHRDFTFASRETGEPRALIETMAQAWTLARGRHLPPELWYGLLRHDPPTIVRPMPPSLPAILAFGREAWQAKLVEAFELRLIPQTLRARLDEWLSELQRERAQAALHVTTEMAHDVSLAEVLAHAGITEDQQSAFATVLGDHGGPGEDLWRTVATRLGWNPSLITNIKDAIELADLLSVYKPLLSRVWALEQAPTARLLATWTREALDRIVAETGAPSDIDGNTTDENRRGYVDDIRARLRAAYPGVSVATVLGTVDDPDIRRAGDWLHQVLTGTHPAVASAPFDLAMTPATRYVREHGDALFAGVPPQEQTHRAAQLKRVQRLFQLTDSVEQIAALIDVGLDSAHQIARWSDQHFIQQYADHLGGVESATTIHFKARHIQATLLHLYLDMRKVFVGRPLELGDPMHTLGSVGLIPSFNALFGSDNLCACETCLSVLSPAAYFVDLLQFLDLPIAGATTTNLDALLERRPDLAHIQLTCENTNTRIPYVDLVNEILASYVAHDQPFPYNDPAKGVVTGAAEELRANPIAITDAASQAADAASIKMQAAVFPFSLPYHHWLEVIRQYLAHFRLRREALMRQFQPDTDLDTEMAIAAEALALSPQQFEMITLSHFDGASSTLAASLASLYGFVETAAPGTHPANHVTPEFIANDTRRASIKAVQNFLKNISSSPGLTTVVRSAIKVMGEYDVATQTAVAIYRSDHGLPPAGGTEGGFWGALAAEGHAPLSILMSYVPIFLRQTGVSYDELVSLVSGRFLNPQFNERVFFTKLGITPEELTAFVRSGAATIPPTMLAKITTAGVTPATFLEHVSAFRSVLVLDSPPDAVCDLDQTTIRHIDGQLLTERELLRLQQAIRLRRKVGWSQHEIDLVLSAYPLSDPFTLILRVADIAKLLVDLAIPLDELMSLWQPIDTWDEQSLYERLFRSKTAQALDPSLALDDVRREIAAFAGAPGAPPLLTDHAPLLMAACRISRADLDAIIATLGNTWLNLQNVSALHRIVVLARALGLAVTDIGDLESLSGVDPFDPPAGQIDSAAMRFVRIGRAVAAGGFSVPQLNYLVRHRPGSGDRQLLTADQRRDALGALRAAIEDVDREYVVSDDPQGDRLVRQLGSVLPPAIAQTFTQMIYGGQIYTSVLPGLPSGVAFPAAVAGKITYDADRQQLRFAGVMLPAEQTALEAPAFVNALPAAVRVPFVDAVEEIFAQPAAFAERYLFDLGPTADLTTLLRSAASLRADGTIDLPAVTAKVAVVLARVRRFVSTTLVKRTLSDTLQLAGTTVAVLLEDEAVLSTLRVAGPRPAVEDFFEMHGSGLSASYFNNGNLTGAPALERVEAEVAYDGALALPAGIGPAPFSARWTGYVYAPLTEDFTFVVKGGDAIRVWINGTLMLDEWKAQPPTEFTIVTRLRKGSLNRLVIEHAHYAGAFVADLWWRSPTIALARVPADALYTGDALAAFVQPLERLEKIAMLANSLQLSAADAEGVSRLGYVNWNGIPVTEPPTPAAVVALFNEWWALQQFAATRDRVSKRDRAFVDVLSSATLDDALDRFASATGASRSDIQKFADAATHHPFDAATSTYSNMPPGVRDLSWWATLSESCAAVTRTGCSAEQIIAWSVVKDVTRVAPAPPVVNWYAMSLVPAAVAGAQAMAQDLKRLVKAKYDETAWRTVTRAISDAIRLRDRDALTAYVLNMPAILDRHLETADDLFEFFLIDVKMDPCMETSRIQQGIATIQLFLQRALMGLEEDAVKAVKASSIDRKLYEIMQSYALWQPGREILIHPEKYIRWDLLDRKSEPYAAFERDLRSQDLTQIYDAAAQPGRWAETAFMNFLEGIDEVAKLQISAIYEDMSQGVFHVFGRTHNMPYRFFYRRAEYGLAEQLAGVGLNPGQWTAWERLPVDIDAVEDTDNNRDHPHEDNDHSGAHLIPVMWNRRLYLFWPQFRLVPDEDYNTSIPPGFDRVNAWEIKLAWSELWNAAWTPKQVSMSSIASRPALAIRRAKKSTSTTIRPSSQKKKVWVEDPTGFWPYDLVAHPGHWKDFTVWDPGVVQNELLPPPGITISDPNDYAVFTEETNETDVGSRLSPPESHWFRLGAVDDRLTIVGAVRDIKSHVVAKRLTMKKQSLLVKQGDKLTFRDASSGPDESTESYGQMQYFDIGVFTLGHCKVRDVEAVSSSAVYDYWKFGTASASFNSFQCCKHHAPRFAVDDPQKIVLRRAKPIFTVTGYEDVDGFKYRRPFFSHDRDRVYLVTPVHRWFGSIGSRISVDRAIHDVGLLSRVTQGSYRVEAELQFQLHCHPQICEFIRRLNREGLFALLATGAQQLMDTTPTYFESEYQPTAYVATPYPDEKVDFDPSGAYGQYNWELFLYAPMRTWMELLRTYQFLEAERFLKAVVDITSSDSTKPLAERVWQFKPFQTADPTRIQDMLESLLYTDAAHLKKKHDMQVAIQEWLRDPYNPHLIARRRLSAYMQAVLMDCCRHYLAAADYEFTRYTMESIPRALQYLIIVVKILGPNRPQPVATPGIVQPETYHTLKTKGHLSPFSEFSLAVADLETELPFTHSLPPTPGSSGAIGSILAMYFCIPPDDEWARIWDTVSDRLFKIRHCMNIEGIVQELPLFPEPIDAMLLVEARAKGLDISSILDDFQAPLPHHEFSVMFEKALRMADDVRAFAQRFEALLERSETEGLAQMRIEQEADWLKNFLRRELVQTQAMHATTREAVEKTRVATQARLDFYQEQLDRGLTEGEKSHRDLMSAGRNFEGMAQGVETQASIVAMIPDVSTGTGGSSFGGTHLSAAFRAVAGFFHSESGQANYEAAMAALNAQWERRRDEWTLQSRLAALDLQKIDVELLAARIQENVDALRIENHDKTAANTQAVLDFYRQRFFNSEQYRLIAEDLYPDFFQLFQLAYAYARQAEACCRFQLGLPSLKIIQFGYWDTARKGLLAGEHLHLALKQLERAYLDADKREYEIRRDISLMTLDPQAFITLKQTGNCEFEIPEVLFDGDYPGHYMRRLRSVSVTIPCVVGRYTNLNCVLTLLKNKTRVSTEIVAGAPGNGYAENADQTDARFVDNFAAVESIATSHGQNDSGLFDMEAKDGRYLPFRCAGVVSRWRVDLPRETNSFDRGAFTDLLLHFQYTARPGGDPLREAAWHARELALKDPAGLPQRRLFSGRGDARDVWHLFLHPGNTADAQTLGIDLSGDLFSPLFRERTVIVSDVDVYLNFKNTKNHDVYRGGVPISAQVYERTGATKSATVTRNLVSLENLCGGTPFGSFPLNFSLAPGVVSTLTIDLPEGALAGLDASLKETVPGTAHVRLKADVIDDVWAVVQYTVQ